METNFGKFTIMMRKALVKEAKAHGIDEATYNDLTTDELKAKLFEMDGGVTPAPINDNNDHGEVVERRLIIAVQPSHQLGRDCFVGKIKYRDLAKLSPDPEAQRPESKRRIPEIAAYVAANDGYFPSVAVTVVGDESECYYDGDERFGELIVTEAAHAYIGDGQHRWYGILEWMAKNAADAAERMDDDLLAVIYVNTSLNERRQMFADINMNAKKPPRAISDSFDERDAARRLAHELVQASATFRGKTSFLKTRISSKDAETFTFSIIVDVVRTMFDEIDQANLGDAVEFWRQADAAMGKHFDAKNFAVTKNAMVAMAKLFGMSVNFDALAALDWSANGELSRVASIAGGSNAATKALFDEIKTKVVD
jgi:DGQHR domain-containing protein